MIHFPVNHRLRPLYRFFAGLVGTYILAFGIVGVSQTRGMPLFSRAPMWVLGLRTNLAFALMSVVAGAIVLIGTLIGRNVDRMIDMAGGIGFLTAGIVMMTLLQTRANVLNFSMATCIVSFVFGITLGVAGLYGKVGSREQVRAEEAFRHGGRDPVRHAWQQEPGVPHRPADPQDPEKHRFA